MVILPVLLIVATEVLPEENTPPAGLPVTVSVSPRQTTGMEDIAAAGLSIFIRKVSNAVPQDVSEKVMMALPALLPVTMPVADNETIEVDVVLQVPVAGVSASVVLLPIQVVREPVILPTAALGFTVILRETESLEQVLVTLYTMVAVPAFTPYIPPVRVVVATELFVERQVPPGLVADQFTESPRQTVTGPESVPATAAACTSNISVSTAVPQPLVTV